jgi:hypothetical protein
MNVFSGRERKGRKGKVVFTAGVFLINFCFSRKYAFGFQGFVIAKRLFEVSSRNNIICNSRIRT